ncbi:MATE family efflux transporter [Piscinibacterium candidicorallinum]|uniref:Multidrug-efflux transporter n=1 Tax=Piscinibacterium candidicorallinum TaxID=1793872 RepID=A0ABV7H480_9BURK
MKDIFKLAWPMLIAQLAVMANALIDTVMVGRTSAVDLASVSLAASIYATVFVSLMGVCMALQPVAAQHFGAKRFTELGEDTVQACWLALGLALVGGVILAFPAPWLAWAIPSAEVAAEASKYLTIIAWALPAALLLRVGVSLNSAIGRPRVTMYLNLGGVAMKIPLNTLFIWGAGPIPAMGAAGCAAATLTVAWVNIFILAVLLRRDPAYALFRFHWVRPAWTRMRTLLALGIPNGAAVAIEVSSFTLIAVLVARMGAEVAGAHQILANLAALAFMVPLALSNASAVLVGQSLGAHDYARALRHSRQGLALCLGSALAVGAAFVVAGPWIARGYTNQAGVASLALALMPILAWFHCFDAAQGCLSGLLRAYKRPAVATAATVIYAASLWGLGLTGGFWLAYHAPRASGAVGWGLSGFWIAAAVGVMVAAAGLALLLRWVEQRELKPHLLASGASGCGT